MLINKFQVIPTVCTLFFSYSQSFYTPNHRDRTTFKTKIFSLMGFSCVFIPKRPSECQIFYHIALNMLKNRNCVKNARRGFLKVQYELVSRNRWSIFLMILFKFSIDFHDTDRIMEEAGFISSNFYVDLSSIDF